MGRRLSQSLHLEALILRQSLFRAEKFIDKLV